MSYQPTYQNYQVCRINRDVHDGQEMDIHVDWSDYVTMKPGSWESVRIIDAVLAILEKDCQNAIFVSTDLTASFFGVWLQVPTVEDWPLHHLDFPETGKNFFPFLKEENHWVHFTLDMDASTASFFDPMERTTESLFVDETRVCKL
ncbi:hypothetical protein QAD02_013878 [Eretmocerus hayati]|uniref:Uncharacterized protein n=1 Tax=Eretmocerus hayati TaxID=131215 RepID=A0ACC2P4X8_9HYME|nr:hypothetical protein QAD02_013878 [Eretmocerus hayati]